MYTKLNLLEIKITKAKCKHRNMELGIIFNPVQCTTGFLNPLLSVMLVCVSFPEATNNLWHDVNLIK